MVLDKADNNWCAFTPDDIGVIVATGATCDEAVTEFRSALRFHLESMRREGLPVPDVRELEVRELIAA